MWTLIGLLAAVVEAATVWLLILFLTRPKVVEPQARYAAPPDIGLDILDWEWSVQRV